jgi:ubiquitin-conjugating enzyme E2 U
MVFMIVHGRVFLFDLKQGGVFQVDVIFNEDYDSQPPLVSFVTIPFHPNSTLSGN